MRSTSHAKHKPCQARHHFIPELYGQFSHQFKSWATKGCPYLKYRSILISVVLFLSVMYPVIDDH